MRLTSRRRIALFSILTLVVAGVALGGAPAPDGRAAESRVVNDVPSAATPNIADGSTYAITKVGDKIVVGGTFTKVADRGSTTTVTRTKLLAFDASTGKLDTGFAPNIVGSSVGAVLPGPNDHTVYVGGSFSKINDTGRANLALLDTDTGELVSGFTSAGFNSAVTSLRESGGHLLVGGQFSKAGSTTRQGLASVSPTSGALDSYLDVPLAGHHNYDGASGHVMGAVGASAMDVSPDGRTLAVVGNFTTADQLPRDQIVRITLGATSAAVDEDWSTSAYEDTCNPSLFDGYVRGIDFSPDGSYFAVAATGGYGGTSSACDAAARFETDATGDADPTWVEFTGSDTLYSVAATEKAIYVGGHQRWLNNHDGHDFAGAGAVPRPGLGALDPRTGSPLSWNPGRNPRGVGARALFVTDSGMYVGQDTDYIGNRKYQRGKVAYFPYEGGKTIADENTGSLPGTVVLSRTDGVAIKRSFNGTTAGSDQTVGGTATWASVRGTFMVNGTLYYGYTDDTLRKRSFDGTTFGTVTNVDPYNDPAWSDVQTGSGQTYRGLKPTFYPQLSDITGMAYRDGRLYYTLSGKSGLYYRTFSPDSGAVSNVEHKAADMDRWSRAGGMFLVGDTLYFGARTSGNLYKTPWTDGAPNGTLTTVSGPGVDGKNWNTRAMLLVAKS